MDYASTTRRTEIWSVASKERQMADTVQMHARFVATGFDLRSQESQGWIATGWSRGMVITVAAWPQNLFLAPSDSPLEVRNLQLYPDGNFTFDVFNANQTPYALTHYGIFISWTDLPT